MTSPPAPTDTVTLSSPGPPGLFFYAGRVMDETITPNPEHPHAFGPTPNLERIPAILKERCLWCLWKAVPREGQPGKFDKIPIGSGGTHLSTTSEDGWLSFERVAVLYGRNKSRCNGIGVLVRKADKLGYIDVDRSLEPPAGLPSTYTELSPSLQGLRMIFDADALPEYDLTKPVEFYAGNAARFLTITGLALSDQGVTHVNGELPKWVAQFKQADTAPVRSAPMPELADVSAISLAGLGLPDAAFDALTYGFDQDDRSSQLMGAVNGLYRAGLDDAQVLALLADTEAMTVALDHRRQDQDKALEYLWGRCLKAKDRVAKELRQIGAEFAGGETAGVDNVDATLSKNSRDYKLIKDFIFVANLNKFVDAKTKDIISPEALNTILGHVHKGTKGNPKALAAFMQSPHKKVVDRVGWRPCKDETFMLDHLRLANTYRGISVEPKEDPEGIAEWLALCSHIYGEYVDLVLDHMAFSIQHPLTKIRWQILTLGETRTGKSMTAEPVKRIWGEAGGTISPQDAKKGWGDAYFRRKMLTFEEVYQPGDQAFFNALKPMLANDGLMQLDIKGKSQIVQENLFSMYLFTNHADALHLDADDDKLLVIKAPPATQRWEGGRYVALGKRIDDGSILPGVLHFLLNRDVTQFKYAQLPVRTAALAEMVAAGRADYQQAMLELLEGDAPPFDGPVVYFQDVRRTLKELGYKFGDKGLREVLSKAGMKQYRGTKKINGKMANTSTFWTREDLDELGVSEIYDWWSSETASEFSRGE